MYRLPWPARLITPSPSICWSAAKHIWLFEVHCKNFKLHGFRAAKPLIMAFLVCRQDMVRRNSSFCILPSLLSLLRLDDLGTIAGISGNNTHVNFRGLSLVIAFFFFCCCDEATHSAMGSKAVETGLVCGNGPELDGNSLARCHLFASLGFFSLLQSKRLLSTAPTLSSA